MLRYFRNKKDISSIEDILVDEGSLWILNSEENLLVLDDDDQYVTSKPSEKLFEEAL